jgi:hypothetical protein
MVKDAEMSSQRDREHSERMMQLSKIEMDSRAQQGGMDILGNAASMLAQFGIEPSEILPKIFAKDEESGGGWLDALPSLLGVAAEVAKVGMASKGGPPQLPMVPQQQIPMQPHGFGDPAMMAPSPFMAQEPAPMFGHEPQQAATEPNVAEEAPPVAAPVTVISARAAAADLPLKSQKAARIGLRNLVRKLSSAGQEEWESHILESLSGELAIYHYVKAVSVAAALHEAGAPEPLAEAIMMAMKQNTIIPDDLPFSEQDL